jgi:hypothetical protein
MIVSGVEILTTEVDASWHSLLDDPEATRRVVPDDKA